MSRRYVVIFPSPTASARASICAGPTSSVPPAPCQGPRRARRRRGRAHRPEPPRGYPPASGQQEGKGEGNDKPAVLEILYLDMVDARNSNDQRRKGSDSVVTVEVGERNLDHLVDGRPGSGRSGVETSAVSAASTPYGVCLGPQDRLDYELGTPHWSACAAASCDCPMADGCAARGARHHVPHDLRDTALTALCQFVPSQRARREAGIYVSARVIVCRCPFEVFDGTSCTICCAPTASTQAYRTSSNCTRPTWRHSRRRNSARKVEGFSQFRCAINYMYAPMSNPVQRMKRTCFLSRNAFCRNVNGTVSPGW